MLALRQNLTQDQRNIVLLALPAVLFAADYAMKSMAGINTETRGPDLALVAIGLDVSALILAFTTVNTATPATEDYLQLLIVLLVVDLALWGLALWGVRSAMKGTPRWSWAKRTASTALGFFAVYWTLVTVLQHVLGSG